MLVKNHLKKFKESTIESKFNQLNKFNQSNFKQNNKQSSYFFKCHSTLPKVGITETYLYQALQKCNKILAPGIDGISN